MTRAVRRMTSQQHPPRYQLSPYVCPHSPRSQPLLRYPSRGPWSEQELARRFRSSPHTLYSGLLERVNWMEMLLNAVGCEAHGGSK
jgi:hypothetical protein